MFTKVEMMDHTVFWVTLPFQCILHHFEGTSKIILSKIKPKTFTTTNWILILDLVSALHKKVLSAQWRAKIKLEYKQLKWLSRSPDYMSFIWQLRLLLSQFFFPYMWWNVIILRDIRKKNSKTFLTDVIAGKTDIIFLYLNTWDCRQLVECLSNTLPLFNFLS